jgi:PEP-CTERM motif
MATAVKSALRLCLLLAAILATARSAQATTINPDLSVLGTVISYDGVDFAASCTACTFSWTDPSGGFGGVSYGNFSLNWKPSVSNFSFLLTDADGTFSGILGTLLAGTVTSFAANVFNPGPGASFGGTLALTTTNLGFGGAPTFTFSSFDFGSSAPSAGTADVDLIATVPEPATLSLVGLGALFAIRRRRGDKKSR